METGWEASATAWIADQGEHGDFGRQFVLDVPMQARVMAALPDVVADIGCGEGRFCRWMQSQGIRPIGLDPTKSLLSEAQRKDPDGDYRLARAEALELDDRSVDMALFYLTLIDIEDMQAALLEAERVVRPGGRVLIANLQPFVTAARSFNKQQDGAREIVLDRYLKEWSAWYEWRGIRIRNWHRPLSAYMSTLLTLGLQLTAFEEPLATGGVPRDCDHYNQVPYFYLMEWQKPAADLQ